MHSLNLTSSSSSLANSPWHWMTLCDRKSMSTCSRGFSSTSTSTSCSINCVSRGRLAPRSNATGPPRAQNRNVGRGSLKWDLFMCTMHGVIVSNPPFERLQVLNIVTANFGQSQTIRRSHKLMPHPSEMRFHSRARSRPRRKDIDQQDLFGLYRREGVASRRAAWLLARQIQPFVFIENFWNGVLFHLLIRFACQGKIIQT